MEPNLLIEYRCDCGKLLFRGVVALPAIEIKCKRCGKIKTFKDDMRGIRSFVLVVNKNAKVVDACEGVAVLGCSREYALGKSVSDLLPLVRDKHYQEIITADEKSYHIRHNTLTLRDHQVPLESHVVATPDKKNALYNVFNIIK